MAPFIKYTSKRVVADQQRTVENYVNAENISKATYEDDEEKLVMVVSIPDQSGKNPTTAITIQGEEAKQAIAILRKL